MSNIRKLFDKAYAAARERSYTRGILGDAAGNLLSATRPDMCFVRVSQEGRQSVTLAKHLGRVPLRAGLPVRMTFENNVFVIEGVDSYYYDSATTGDQTNNFGIVRHTHALGTGLEYMIEPMRVGVGLVRPNGGWTITIEPARYYTGSTWDTYLGETSLSLLGHRPATSGKHRLVLVTIDPATNTTAIVDGSDQNYATTLTQADIDTVSIGTKIPLAAVLMRADDTTINIQARFIDARGWLNIGGGVSALADLTDTNIVTPSNGQMLYYNSVGGWYNDDAPIVPQNWEDLSDVSFTTLADNDLARYEASTNEWVNISRADLATAIAADLGLAVNQTTLVDWSFRDAQALSTSSYAWKGNRFTPDVDVDIYALCYFGTIVANGVYQAAVITGTATPGNVATATKTASYTAGSSPATLLGGHMWLEFATPVTLTAGTQYGLMVGRTDGAGTYQLPVNVNGGTNAANAVPLVGLSHGTVWRVADATLTIGTAINEAGGNSMACGFRFRYPTSIY